MTDEISRRGLVAMAGVGLALAGCAPGESDGNGSSGKTSVDAKGATGNHGADPGNPPPRPNESYWKDFDPKFIALLYIGLNQDWSITVNHASFNFTGSAADHAAERQQRALALFKARGAGTFGNLAGTANEPYKRSDGTLDFSSFEKFGFWHPTEIFIFIEQVGSRTPTIALDPKELISFGTRLIEKEVVTKPDGTTYLKNIPAEENYSFFNAREVPAADLNSQGLYGAMIRLQNYVTNDGGEIQAANQRYALNIHFTAQGPLKDAKDPKKGYTRIPMIIDPDTGNGTGNEP